MNSFLMRTKTSMPTPGINRMPGTVASNGSARMSLIAMEATVKEQKEIKKRTRKEHTKPVVHELFETCSTATNDPYWRDLLKNCARDKFPTSVLYRIGVLSFKKGSKIDKYGIPEGTLEEVTDYICNFFRHVVGLWSEQDYELMKAHQDQLLALEVNVETEWKDVKKLLREKLIYEYVDLKAIELKLTNDQRSDLVKVINFGFLHKDLSSKNIILEGGIIKEITGIMWNQVMGTFFFSPEAMKITPMVVKG